MSRLDRRTFFKLLATASGAAPAALHAAHAVTPAPAQGRVVWKKAPCLLCDVGCGMLVGIQNGRAVAIKGDVDAPVSKGLACAKGYHAVQALYAPDRIRQAMVRRNGALVPVTLTEAYAVIAQNIRRIAQQHGRDSLGLFGSGQWSITDAYVAAKLMKAGLGTNNIDTDTRLFAASAQAGAIGSLGADGAAGCFDDVDHADVVVLWNHNMSETNPVLFSRILERRRTGRARVVEVCTRTTRTSYAVDRSIVFAPHSEIALANSIAEQIVSRGHADRAFINRHVAFKEGRTDIGYGLANDAVAGDVAGNAAWSDYIRFLKEYTPRRAQAVTGVAPEDVTWLASLYGDVARKVVSIWGTEINQNVRGTWTNNAIINLHLLVGKIGSPGNGVLSNTAQPSGGAATHDAGAAPDALPRGSVTNAEDRALAARIWGMPARKLNARPGERALSMFRALEHGDLRFLWVQGSDPAVSLPNLQRYRSAMRRSDSYIVVSDAYPTATTELADVVLPAALWVERAGVYASAERRLHYVEAMIQPPGDARSDAWHMIEVAHRLKLEGLFPWTEATHVPEAWREYTRFHDHPARRLPALQSLQSGCSKLWPDVAGRETRWRFSTTHDPAADKARGEADFYGHADHRAWIWLRPYAPPAEAPDAQYPFWLAAGAILEHSGTGSLTRRIPVLHRAAPHAYAELNASDAEALAIRNGDRIRLISRRGRIELTARVNQRSQPARGQVFVPVFDESTPVNLLTLDACCPISGQPDYQKCAVRVERVS